MSFRDNRRADPRRERIQRTLNVSGAGSVLLQVQINRIVQLLTLRYLGVQQVLDVRPGSGNAAYINRRTAGTTGAVWVADTDAASEETGTYAQTPFTYRTLLTQGTVTRKLVATARSYGDAVAQEMIGKTEDFAQAKEDGLVTGNSGAGGNANSINGLLTLANATSSQVVANSTLTTGSALVLSKLDEAIDVVKGANNRSDLVIFASQLGGRKLNAALQAQQQFVNETEIRGGFRVKSYDGIPIVTSTSIPNTLTWSGSVSTGNTAFSGGSCTAIIVVNKRYVWIEDLTPQTVMPLAQTTSQSQSFQMFEDLALVASNPLGMSILGGISGS